MQNSKKIKPILFLLISAGFFMIATVCIVAKNKSLLISNYYEDTTVEQDSLKQNVDLKNVIKIENPQIDFPIKGKAWRIERSFTLSY